MGAWGSGQRSGARGVASTDAAGLAPVRAARASAQSLRGGKAWGVHTFKGTVLDPCARLARPSSLTGAVGDGGYGRGACRSDRGDAP